MTARSPIRRWITLCAAVPAIALAAAVPPASAASPVVGRGALHGGPARVVGSGPARGAQVDVRSTNWAGYVDKGHAFTFVKASWVVPRVTCTQDDSVVSFWVGIDGYSSKTVEQAGTMAYCHSGKVSYYTWWEMFPTTKTQLVGSSVKPGDHVTASIAVSGNSYTLKVIDATHKTNSFTKKTSCSSCRNASAEWMAERPARQQGLFPLAKFGHLAFYGSRVGVGKARGSISHYGHDEITMINHDGQTMARVSGLQRGGNRFLATWLRMQ